MKKIYNAMLGACAIMLFAQCNQDEFLTVSSPDKTDNEFVTSTVNEALKCVYYCYNRLRSNAGGGNYNWNDCQSDAEYYPEKGSGNGMIGFLLPGNVSVNKSQGLFNTFFEVTARAQRLAVVLAEKPEYKEAAAAGQKNAWTQLYGECVTLNAWCYLELTRHWGDVPYGIENTKVNEYALSSRWTIWDNILEELKSVEPLMYDLGEGGVNAERMSRSFANGLMGEISLLAGSYQTIREDVPGLYGEVTFDKKYTTSGMYSYARRSDYQTYLTQAQSYLRKATGERKGSAAFLIKDDRTVAQNPFQRNFQYIMDLEVSPESFFETGNMQPLQSERPYSQGRPSDGGGSAAAPCKVFGGIRVTPTFYYTGYEDGDMRWDASAVVTGSAGDGTEKMVRLISGSRTDGGIAINKWDINKMKVPYTTKSRNSGMNYQLRRMTNYMLMLAEVDMQLNAKEEALSLINQMRERAFGDKSHNLTSITMDDVLAEVARETLGEGDIKWSQIRTGVFTERSKKLRSDLTTVIAKLESQGFYEFPNGRQISTYIWTKMVSVPGCMTYNRVEGDPALSPGWRGQFDYKHGKCSMDVSSKVTTDKTNVAIQGLFKHIAPGSAEAAALVADGYKQTDWAIGLVKEYDGLWDINMLSGIDLTDVPLYYHPIPQETLLQSGKCTDSASKNGYNIWNGYGLPNE